MVVCLVWRGGVWLWSWWPWCVLGCGAAGRRVGVRRGVRLCRGGWIWWWLMGVVVLISCIGVGIGGS